MSGRGLELAASARPTFDGGLLELTFALPTTAVKGDLVVVLVVRNAAVVAPAGWTQIETALGAGALFLDAWARLVDDNEPAEAVFTTAVGQELQGQLLLFGRGAPALVREASATAAFAATVAPGTPAASSVQAISLLCAIYSADAAVVLTSPSGFTEVDSYDTAIVAPRTLLVCYRVAGTTGLISPGAAASAPASTGRAFLLVLRERAPVVPVELLDPVPGNIGLLPL